MSGLLGGPAGQSLDSSVDVVFWGLARGEGKVLVEAFDRLFELLKGCPDLLSLLALVFLHCNLQLLEVGEDTAILYDKYEPYLAPVLPQIEEVKKVGDVKSFLKDLEEVRRLRSEISVVEKEVAALSSTAAPRLPPSPTATIQATLHDRSTRLNELRTILQKHLNDLAPFPYLTRLRAFRTIMTIPPASLALLESHLRHPSLSPISAIIYTRFVLGSGPVPSHRLEDASDPNGNANDPRIRWGFGRAAAPDFTDDFNRGILRGQRLMASLSHADEKSTNARPKGLKRPRSDPFNPTVCAFQVTPNSATVGRGGVTMSSRPASCVAVSCPDARRVVAAVGNMIHCYKVRRGRADKGGGGGWCCKGPI